MDLVKVREMHAEIRESRFTQLADDLIRSAVRYARMRTDWQLVGTEERRTMDAERSRAHDAFIDCCNILSRNMQKAGEDVSWREALGHDRKVIGDFACCLHAVLGILAR